MSLNLSEDQLDLVEEYSGQFLNYRQIAVLLDVPFDAILAEFDQEASEVSRRYLLGKTKSELALRKKVISLALMGSPSHMAIATQYIADQFEDEVL